MNHLHVVDAQTGEIKEDCESCALLRDQLAGAEREIRAHRTRYAKLARDKEGEAHNHPLWDEVNILFKDWKRICGHPRSKFTVERFELALPYLEREGMVMCRRAIKGAGHDPHTAERKNGSIKRYDDWGLIFRDPDHFEEMCNRSPRGDT